MKTCILNCSNPVNIERESDEYTDLRDRSSCFDDNMVVKHCRSWHSWAYALETEFFVYNKQGWPGVFKYENVIVLVNRDIDKVAPIVSRLKKAGKKVAICFHEGIQDFLFEWGERWTYLKILVDHADFYINIFGQCQEFFKGWLGEDKVKFVNHTAPFDWEHGLTIPWDERTGDILCGTRTFYNQLSRNTFLTLGILKGFQKKNPDRKIDFICEDEADVSRMIKDLGIDFITLHKGPLEYNEWLRFLANYKYVAHSDTSINLSQIVFDCAMLDIFCVGSTGWLNQNIGTSEHGRATAKMTDMLESDKFIKPEDTKKMLISGGFGLEEIKQNLIEAFK